MKITANLRALTTAAAALGVELPDDLRHGLDAVAGLRGPSTSDEIEAATILASITASKPPLDKRLEDAAARLVKDRARGEILAAIQRRADDHFWRLARQHREQIAAAFGAALTPAVGALGSNAPRLPAALPEGDVPNLSPEQFAAWRACTDALTVLHTAWLGLAALYGTEPGTLSREALELLVVVEVPPLEDLKGAVRFARGLDGIAPTGDSSGRLNVAVFPAAAIATAGGRFAFAGPAEHLDRQSRLIAGLTPNRVPSSPALLAG